MNTLPTKGELIIRTAFTSGNPEVDRIKKLYAKLYDEVLAISSWADGADSAASRVEPNYMVQKALLDLETSAMFAVKALTT